MCHKKRGNVSDLQLKTVTVKIEKLKCIVFAQRDIGYLGSVQYEDLGGLPLIEQR